MAEVVRGNAQAQSIVDTQNPVGGNVRRGQRDTGRLCSRAPPSSAGLVTSGARMKLFLATVRVAAFTNDGVKMCVSLTAKLCVTQLLTPLKEGTA